MNKLKFEYRITIFYLIIGGAWIIFSDKFLLTITTDQQLLTQMQTYKGWFYVVTTSILLFFLIRKHIKQLRKAEAEANKSNELKSFFLQNISHEIRTPMNSIVGFSEILETNDLKEDELKKFLAIIRNSSHQLLYIVNQLLDISMLETGNMKVYEDKVDLNKLMDEIDTAFSPTLNREVEFTVIKGLDDQKSIITTDEGKLRQVIMNLLNNAKKFTPSGTIKLSYTLNNAMLKFTVEDTGIGLSEEAHKNIFKRFQKAHDESTPLYDGVGLGLAICKGNIDLLEGDIGFSSSIGNGSVFYFNVPYSPCY
ncbi:MAG TPA: HAMP domain-containing sensor histidine kinase [Draconibacterium sp.]|nr:HAMP domain-containing sensor histidine kinase [Draconibacterium sp.]